MSAGDPVFSTRAALANISRLDSDASGVATAFGEIDNASAPKPDYLIYVEMPISSSATTGSYDLYMVESQDGTDWTDGIDPATDSDYVDFVKDAIPIRSSATIYDNSPTGARTVVRYHFRVCDYVSCPAPYFGFVRVNRSGQTAPATADGQSMSIGVAAS